MNYTVKTVVKQKTYRGDMQQCLPLLKNGRKLVFLSFTNVNPKSSGSNLLARRCDHLKRNAMQCNALEND
jgi:hypothetical protein